MSKTLTEMAAEAAASWDCPAGRAFSKIAKEMLECPVTHARLTYDEVTLLSKAALKTVPFTHDLHRAIHGMEGKKSLAVRSKAYADWYAKVEMFRSMGVHLKAGIESVGPLFNT